MSWKHLIFIVIVTVIIIVIVIVEHITYLMPSNMSRNTCRSIWFCKQKTCNNHVRVRAQKIELKVTVKVTCPHNPSVFQERNTKNIF